MFELLHGSPPPLSSPRPLLSSPLPRRDPRHVGPPPAAPPPKLVVGSPPSSREERRRASLGITPPARELVRPRIRHGVDRIRRPARSTVPLRGRGGDDAIGGVCRGHAQRGYARRGVAARGVGSGGACTGAARGGETASDGPNMALLRRCVRRDGRVVRWPRRGRATVGLHVADCLEGRRVATVVWRWWYGGASAMEMQGKVAQAVAGQAVVSWWRSQARTLTMQ
jgi:hypothetical protein